MGEDLYAAFFRCSEEELQNPELSLDRQLHNCQAAVTRRAGRIVATYYEIETGTSRYEQRGKATNLAGYRIPISRAGGLHELVADANRVPRPFEESFGSILLRHINVGLARGYHFDLMRKTREGRQSGTCQGWHMGGIAAYGYQFSRHEHPNPHKRSRGLSRSRLDLDPGRAPVVRRIFDEYLYGPRGLDEICQLLNSDLDRFPPPVPTDPARRSGVWSRSSVWNPAQPQVHRLPGLQPPRQQDPPRPRQRPQPVDLVHRARPPGDRHHRRVPPGRRHRRKQGALAAHQHPRPARSQASAVPVPRHGPLRLRAAHARLPRKQTFRYYQCQPARLRGRPLSGGHPSGIYVAETALLEGVTGFLATAVYGPERASYWQRALSATDTPDPAAPARARAAELEREIADLQARLRRQVLALEDEQTVAEARPPIVERISELRRDLATRQAVLAKLDGDTPPPPPDPAVVSELLATLPVYQGDLRALPARRLRELMESLHLTISYDHKEHTAQIEITLAAVGEGDLQVVPLVCSGGRTRTCNHGLNRAPLCRLSYAGSVWPSDDVPVAGRRWYTRQTVPFISVPRPWPALESV